MKISAFTFLKNAELLGYPFVESIKSILPIVDEFVINIGVSEDNTLDIVRKMKDPKIKIIESSWNEKMQQKGYVYGQQKMIAQFNCQGDWLFYIEADEIYHEKDINEIRTELTKIHTNSYIEAVAVNFIHFYGNGNTYLDSPGWYRSETRIIRNTIRTYAPDGLFWLVLDKNRKGRYPRAKKINVNCYHYGWVRPEDKMNLKSMKVQKYWNKNYEKLSYKKIDSKILKRFEGSHPSIISDWLPQSKDIFRPAEDFKISKKQRKHRLMKFFENIFGVDLSKKHYKQVK